MAWLIKFLMEKKLLLGFLLIVTTSCFGQSIRLTSDVGYSLTKLYKDKRIAFYQGIGFGIEKYLSNNWYLELLPNTYTIQFSSTNSSGQNTFTSIRFVELNAEAKKYLLINAKSRIYLSVGIYGGSLLNRTVENNTMAIEETSKNLGYNFGLSSAVGLRVALTRVIAFDIGIADKDDVLFDYAEKNNKVDNTKRFLKLSFYLRIKK